MAATLETFNATSAPVNHPAYTVATAPAAASYLGAHIFVSDGGAGSPCMAFSDGTNWKRTDTIATTIAAS